MASPYPSTNHLLDEFYQSRQLDELQASLVKLENLHDSGDIRLILEQKQKSQIQKEKFINRIIESLPSSELQVLLKTIPLQEKAFMGRDFKAFLRELSQLANSVVRAPLEVALIFKEPDLQEMAQLLKKKIKRPVVLDVSVKPSLIGGLIVKTEKETVDTSLASRLRTLGKTY